MKQFSLEEYLANPSKKVVRRDGRKVTRFLCTDAKGDYPIVALVEKFSGSEMPISYTKKGENRIGAKSDGDLFFAPEKHEGWVNIYKAEVEIETFGCLVTRYAGLYIWPTEDAAKTAADPDPVATVKIEWEE